MTSQDDREVVVPVNSSVATKITRVNPPKFHGSKVEEDLMSLLMRHIRCL